MTNVGHPVGQGFEELGAMPLPLACCPHAHLFQQEVVLASRALKVPEGESQQIAIGGSHPDAVCTRNGEEVGEALGGVLDPP